MSSFVFDSNGTPVPVRKGDPIGGVFTPGTSISTDTWLRLMPNGDATQLTGEPRKLNLGTSLRSDIAGSNLKNWQFYILNSGHAEPLLYRISEHNTINNDITLASTAYETIDVSGLPDTVEYVMCPKNLMAFTLHNQGASTNDVEIGYSPTSDDDNVVALSVIGTGNSLILPMSNLQNLFYKYAAIVAADKIEWGEHYKA